MEISVIIPAYNAELYIERCLNSLVNQTINVPYEIIVINDGSKDNTEGKILDYLEKYPQQMKYFSKSNGGQSSARNMGLDKAEGRYIAFVDSDDYVEPDYLAHLYELCQENGADISMCAMNRCYGDNGEGNIFDSGFQESFLSKNIAEILKKSSFAPWNKLYRSELWKGVRFPEGMTYEDFAIVPQVLYKAGFIAYQHKILYHYYVNTKSTIVGMKLAKKTDRNIFKAYMILEKSELINQRDVLENFYIRRVLSNMAWNMCEYGEGFDEVHRLVDYALVTYPNLSSNKILYESTLPIVKKVFIRLLLRKRFWLAKSVVSVYSSIKQLGKTVMKYRHS